VAFGVEFAAPSFFLGADAIIVVFSLFVAFLVHFDFNSNIRYFSLIGEIVLFFVALKLLPVWGAPIKISVLWVEAKDL